MRRSARRSPRKLHASRHRPARIALAGAHDTGKSTLAAALAKALPRYRLVDEPYHAMEADGHRFADPPTVADFEDQLRRSVADLAAAPAAVILDRCPVDLFAYLCALAGPDAGVTTPWFPDMARAAAALDLIVFVPIERPDRVRAPSAPRLRRTVDHLLRAGLVEDEWGLAVPVLEVSGSPRERAGQVLARVTTAPFLRA